MGVNDLWKLLREEGLMQEWSAETHAQAAQKAVAEQVEGMLLYSLSDTAAAYRPTRTIFPIKVPEMHQAAMIVLSMPWQGLASRVAAPLVSLVRLTPCRQSCGS